MRYSTTHLSYDAVAMYRPHGENATRTTNLVDLNVWTGREVMRSVRMVLLVRGPLREVVVVNMTMWSSALHGQMTCKVKGSD